MLLDNKNVIIYGAGGSIGGAVAKEFAREGASVFLTGRNRENLETVAKEITAAGGAAEVAVVDALDEEAVEEHARAVASRGGSIDVSFNLVSRGDVQGIPLVEMTTDDFVRPVTTGLTTTFITARAARCMVEQGSGVILALDSGSAHGTPRMMGGTGPADAAIDTLALDDAAYQGLLDSLDRMRMTRRSPRLDEVATTAAFLASEKAGTITGTFVNVTSGTFPS